MASALSNPIFHNEAAAYRHVEARIWPNGPFCPHCGCTDRISAIKPNPEKRVRIGLKKCGDCKKQFTVKVGTVFESSHVPLNMWLQAIALICSSKKGFSSNQLARVLGVTVKTAWFMSHRIREAMSDDGGSLIGGGGASIEIDETFLGNQPYVFTNEEGWKRKTGQSDLTKIVTAVERGGRARSIKVENLRKAEIGRALESVSRDSHLNTDKARHYGVIGREFLSHGAVNHNAEEYGRWEDGRYVHTNTVEGTFSIFKRGMRGNYQHCSEKHVQRYLAEFDFRYNNRAKLGVDDKERADRALKGIVGKRLTYRTTSARRPGAEARVVW
jgi:transposase-like protein